MKLINVRKYAGTSGMCFAGMECLLTWWVWATISASERKKIINYFIINNVLILQEVTEHPKIKVLHYVAIGLFQ